MLMAISKTIDFSGVKTTKVFHKMTKQYNALTNLNESAWTKYMVWMIKKGISVCYDAIQDAYIATPIKENKMTNDKKYLLQDEDGMDMESGVMDLINSINLQDDGEEEPVSQPGAVSEPPQPSVDPAPPVQKSAEPSINLAQFEQLLNRILGGSKGEIEVPNETPEQQQVENGTFLGNPLETEFETNSDSIGAISSKISSESYADTIGANGKSKTTQTSSPVPSTQPEPEVCDEPEEVNDMEIEELPSESATDEGEVEELDEAESLTEEFPPYGSQEDEYMGEQPDDAAPIKPITANVTQNMGGQPVQIILTGVMITPGEIQYVAESVKASGMKLKAIKGVKKVLNIIVENAGKQYTIRYEDMPKYKSKTPFSIKQYTFQSLDEALERINYTKKTALKESDNFKKLVGKELVEGRTFSDIKESNILKEFQGKISEDYIPGWNVRAVGSVNLKNGLNEVYSNITEHSDEPNTLVKTKDGQYFMIKGNLKERSEVGTKRHLIDLQGKKDFGVAQVVGIYENSFKGLGAIMYKLKKTTLPLLAWK